MTQNPYVETIEEFIRRSENNRPGLFGTSCGSLVINATEEYSSPGYNGSQDGLLQLQLRE